MKIYLAGAIEGLSYQDAMAWREVLKDLAPRDWKFLFPKITDDVNESMNFDNWLINEAGIVIAKIDKKVSMGTAIELGRCSATNKLIVCFTLEDIEFHGWLKHISVACLKVESLAEVIDYVKHLEEHIR